MNVRSGTGLGIFDLDALPLQKIRDPAVVVIATNVFPRRPAMNCGTPRSRTTVGRASLVAR